MPGTRKLGRPTDQRMAMLRQQVTDFLATGRMETTVTRCKEIAPLAEKMISLAKEGGLANYRQALAFLPASRPMAKAFLLSSINSGFLPSRRRIQSSTRFSSINCV